MKTLEVNDYCNESCVADVCFTPKKLVMDWSCVVYQCNCTVNVPKIKAELKDLKKVIKNTTETVVDWVQDDYVPRINDAYRQYRLKQVAVISKIS